MRNRDVDMDGDGTYDLGYDELAYGPSKRQRLRIDTGTGSSRSMRFSNDVAKDIICVPRSDSVYCSGAMIGDKPSSLQLHCRLPGLESRDSETLEKLPFGRVFISASGKYVSDSYPSPSNGEILINGIVGFPSTWERDKFDLRNGFNNALDLRTSKAHQTSRPPSVIRDQSIST